MPQFITEDADLTDIQSNLSPPYGPSNPPVGQTTPPSNTTSTPSSIPTDVVTFVNGTRVTNPDRNVPPETPGGIPKPPLSGNTGQTIGGRGSAAAAKGLIPPSRPMEELGAFARIEQLANPQRTIGTDYFVDINAHGFRVSTQKFSTDYKLDTSGAPINPQSNMLDSKGDFSPRYTKNNKASNVFKTPPTPIQDVPVPADLFLDSKGDFTPVFNVNNKPSQTHLDESRLLNLHTDESFLDNYYARLTSITDPLGIRNDNISNNIFGVNNQPNVIRNIGQRWGENTFQISGVPDGVQKTIDGINDIAESILGRNPATYVDMTLAHINRLIPFATSVAYNLKQVNLQRRNTFKTPTSVTYGLGNLNSKESLQRELTTLASDTTSLLNTRGYNPLSIFSAPGVLHLNRNSNVVDPKVLIDNASSIGKTVVIAGIAGNISKSALQAAAPVAISFVTDLLTPVGTSIAGLKNPLADFSTSLANSDFAKSIGGALSAAGGYVTDKVSKLKNPFANAQNPFAKLSLKGLGLANYQKGKLVGGNGALLVAGAKFVGNTVATGVDLMVGAAKYAQSVAKDFNEAVGKAGKATLGKIDLDAFNNVGVDYVNLIPYGSDNYEGTDYNELDTIPFKFHDIHGDADIVFRAILSGITDTFSPEYASERYVGRPDKVHVYQGTDREISFTFDVYPKSDVELITLWEKLNYLAGLTYPHVTPATGAGGRGMISPYTTLTIGNMYTEAPGYITSLTYTVQDNGTWETTFAKLPKYIQVSVGFAYIGNSLLSAEQKHFDIPSVPAVNYSARLKSPLGESLNILKTGDTSFGRITSFKNLVKNKGKTGETGEIGIGKQGKRILGTLGF